MLSYLYKPNIHFMSSIKMVKKQLLPCLALPGTFSIRQVIHFNFIIDLFQQQATILAKSFKIAQNIEQNTNIKIGNRHITGINDLLKRTRIMFGCR